MRPDRAAERRFAAWNHKVTAERDLTAVVLAGMDLWRTAVYAAITEQQPNREQILAGGFFQHLWRLDSAAAAARTWLRWVDGAVAPSISAVFGEAFNTVRKTATVSPQPYEAAHMADVHDRLVIWPDGAFEELRPELQEALSEAESIGQVQDRVGAVLGIDKQTREHRARINEINRILDDPDADPADKAELLTQKAQLWRDHDESLQDWEWKARRIARTECLPADTPIEGGNITAVYRRHYEGEWIEVETCSGRKIAGTPNHPVLTIDGWKGLGELTEADRLVCHSISVEKACAAGDEHVQDTPPTIGQIFDAVAAVVVPEREATAEPDFHGDGRDGYVDVLRPDWLLRVGRFSALTEGGFDSDLAPSDHRAVAAAAERHSFSRDVPVPYGVSLLEVPDWDARAVQSGCDGSLVDPVARGERLLRYAGHVQADEFFVVEAESIIGETARGELPGLGHAANGNPALTKNVVDGRLVAPNLSGDAGRTPAGRVELDDVVRVHVGRFDGHVYNLTAVEGYFAGPQGIVTSNTQGAVEAGQYEAARASESQLGITLYKRWMCLTGDARVRAEDVLHVARRHHEGAVVRIRTASGATLTATPEHRVMTGRGWVQAQHLDVGDELVHVGRRHSAGAPDVQDIPPRLSEVFDAAVATEPIEVWPMPHGVDLNGEPIHRKVEVVSPDRDLAAHLVPGLGERGEHLVLPLADVLAEAILLRRGGGRDRNLRLDPSAIGACRRVGTCPLTGGVAPDAVAPRSTPVAAWNSGVVEDPHHPRLGHVQCTSDGADGLAGAVPRADVVPESVALGGTSAGAGCGSSGDRSSSLRAFAAGPDHSAGAQVATDGTAGGAHCDGNLRSGHAAAVELDQVVVVEVVPYSGHVYDLTTKSGWFSANSLVVHNSTPDTRTRHSHWLADGQIVRLAERFTVGDAQLMFPGDPSSGVAHAVINCRCSLIYQEADEVQAELQGPDGSIGEVVPQGVRLGPDDPAVVDAKIAELEAADDEHTDTRAEDWAPPLSAPTPESKLHVDNNAHPHGLPKWPEEERARRQLAAVPDFFPGEPLYQHEIEFVERFKARGETMQWIPKAQWDPITRNTPSTSDFLWRNNFSLPTEVKSTRAKYRSIRNAIQRAVETSIANPESPRKENFIIDIGHAQLNEVLRNQVGNYNRRNPGLQINRLWIMHSDGAGFDEIHQT